MIYMNMSDYLTLHVDITWRKGAALLLLLWRKGAALLLLLWRKGAALLLLLWRKGAALLLLFYISVTVVSSTLSITHTLKLV